mgnify:CR=1 FL=1
MANRAGGAAEIAATNLADRRRGGRKKVCKFCAFHTDIIDYKDSNTLKFFLTDRGKVVPRRISGNCATHQRALTTSVKRARNLAFVGYVSTGN